MLKEATPIEGLFCGYASLFGKPDQQGDVIVRGAFADTLRMRGVANIRMLLHHDPDADIGTWIDLRETDRGLYVKGRLNLHTKKGRDVLGLFESGGMDGLSIGFKTIRAQYSAAKGTRQLMEIDLWEVSILPFPMMPRARVKLLHSNSHHIPTAANMM